MVEHRTLPENDLSTDWSEVRKARNTDTEEGMAALSRLIRRHSPWILAHLKTRFQFNDQDAEDVLQSFIQERIISGSLLTRADQPRGSFRALLKNAVNNFALNQIRHGRARRRAPDKAVISLDALVPAEHPQTDPPGDPDDAADVVWAQAVIAGVLLDMHNELVRSNRLDIWEVFEGRVLQPMLNGTKPLDYATLIARFHYSSPSQALNVLVTAKRIFRRHLRAVVVQYARNNVLVDDELAYLKSILAGHPPKKRRRK